MKHNLGKNDIPLSRRQAWVVLLQLAFVVDRTCRTHNGRDEAESGAGEGAAGVGGKEAGGRGEAAGRG